MSLCIWSKINEKITILLEDGRRIEIRLIDTQGMKARFLLDAPKTILIERENVKKPRIPKAEEKA